MKVHLYPCHNHDPWHTDVLVQDGWVYHQDPFIGPTRSPRMVSRPDPMSKDCQHTLGDPKDPRCTGCKWKAP